MKLEDADLNLLRVFNQLMLDRQVSRSAEVLGISQPAVSNALRRLRTLFKDELFLRTAQGMQPTPLAEQLSVPVAQAIETLRSALRERVSFDPQTATRTFTLGLTDIGEMYFLPPLMARLDRLAPGVQLSTLRNNQRNVKEDMEAGHVDMAIGLLPQLQSSFYRQRLFMQRFVWTFRSTHPLARREHLTLDDFLAAQHVVPVSPGTGHGEVDRLMEREGVRRNVRLTVPHFVAVGHVLAATDLVATLPGRMAERIAEPFGLRFVPHPVNLPEVSIDVYWHARQHRDPGNQWLRRLIFDLFAD